MLGPVTFTVGFMLCGIFAATVFAELTALNKFAKANNLHGISNNMFKSASDFWRIRNAVPTGELRSRIKWLEAVGLICWFALMVMNSLAFFKR